MPPGTNMLVVEPESRGHPQGLKDDEGGSLGHVAFRVVMYMYVDIHHARKRSVPLGLLESPGHAVPSRGTLRGFDDTGLALPEGR